MTSIGFCIHPTDRKAPLVYGWFLGPQDAIKKGEDVYASDDGTWRNCDQSWHGMLVQDLPGCVVVRRVRLPHD